MNSQSPLSFRLAGRSYPQLLILTAFFCCDAFHPGWAANSIVAWGNNNNLQSQVPPGLTNAIALDGGTVHSLAIKPDGTVAGWGDNLFGQTNVTGLTNVMAISGGDTFSLILLSNGTVVVRGNQTAAPNDLTNVVAIAAGWQHCLALRQDGTVVGWGDTNAVPGGLTDVVAIAAGDGHSLALLNRGTVTAWGNPAFGKTVVPPGLSNVVAIAAGKDHCLALQQNGRLVAWGRNDDTQATVPPVVTNVVAIAAGAFHNLALRPNGTIAAWGNNVFNQSIVPGWTGFYQIAAGAYHNLGQIGDGQPNITLQPRSQAVTIGKNATFVLMAVGSPTLTYQWRKDGTNLVGRTNNILVVTNIQLSDAASYSVTVSNSVGFATSASATLTPFIGPPVILTQPQDITRFCGENAPFSVIAEGFLPLRYQWQYNGAPIDGATNSQVTLTSVALSQEGGYSVVITNVAGSITSAVASLTVTVVPPVITDEPEDTTVICGEDTFFEVAATSRNPLSYEWRFEGLPLAGATNATLTLISARADQAGHYSVVVSDQCGSATSVVAVLNVVVEPPIIVSPLTANGSQGQPFSYAIAALHSPVGFGAAQLPLGLSFDPTNGVIAGVPLEEGTFTPIITAINECASRSEVLTLTIGSSAPVITSPSSISGEEEVALSYQITATGSPDAFGAQNLPDGLTLDPLTGIISGIPIYGGTINAQISASNIWGSDTITLTFDLTNKVITGLSIANVTFTYSSPYLLDFEFSLRDNDDPNQGDAVVVAPQLLSAVGQEDDGTGKRPISASETGIRMALGSSKVLKANLVLDFTESLASFSYGDTNGNGLSDAVDALVAGAQLFVNQQAASAQIGVYEFHREDFAPTNVVQLTTDKKRLNEAIAGIWTNYVKDFPASSRCWDALTNAITNLGASNRDEQHYVVFISDGVDESSLATVTNVITLATNNGVKIFCIGFGDAVDTATLTAITTETKGRFYLATDAVELGRQFARISKDLYGQYVLRWATLRRTGTSFDPSFTVSYQGRSADSPTNPYTLGMTNIDNSTTPPTTNITVGVTNFIIGPYIPTQYTGTVTAGALRLSADAAVSPTAITLRAAYVPRFIRQLRVHYRANWPCTTTLMSTEPGEILAGWSMTETNDGAGGNWILLSSPNPQSTISSIPFASFGNLVHFNFRDVLNASNAFSLFAVDNSIYTNTGGQSFVIENTNAFVTVYADLPYHTPVPWLIANGFSSGFVAAEISDPDNDGVPTWREYQGNTNPRNASSKFVVRGLSNDIYGRYQITFSTALNRLYRVETSADLINWEIVEEGIAGTGADVTILDHRYHPWIDKVFYRAVVY